MVSHKRRTQDSPLSVSCWIFLQSPSAYINQPKALVAVAVYHTKNVTMNRMTSRFPFSKLCPRGPRAVQRIFASLRKTSRIKNCYSKDSKISNTMSFKDILSCFTCVLCYSGTAYSQLYSWNPVQNNDSKKPHSTTITYWINDSQITDKNTVNFTSQQRSQFN